MKRILDLFAACLGLVILAPLFVAVSLAIRLESPGPILYRGDRAGRGGKVFRIFKFRTMVADAAHRGGGITTRDDPRITRVGRFLRRTKLDELPQLFNVLRGEMSLVGPRPEDPRYVGHYTERQRQVLSVRPGITSIASLRFRREDELLPPDQWEQVYLSSILPAKLDIELSYVANQSCARDLSIILATFWALLRDSLRIDAGVRALGRAENWVGRYLSWPIIDVGLILAAYILAILIRSLDAKVNLIPALGESLVGILIYLGTNYLCGVYHRSWRYASGQEAVALMASAALGTGLRFSLGLFTTPRELPLGAIVIGGLLVFLFLAAARYRHRLWAGLRLAFTDLGGLASDEGARVLIVGAGEEGQLLAWQLQNRVQGQGYQVVGFIDFDSRKRGLRIHNVPVYGDRGKIPEVVDRLHVDLIIIAIPPDKLVEPRQLLALCRATPAQIKILPGVFNWLKDNGREPGWVDVNEDELLQRSPYRVDAQACCDLLCGRVVMVTGAAGSIGGELCRQIAAYQPARLVLVDFNESGLHDLRVELLAKQPDLALDMALQDITDAHGMALLFERVRPQLVFHVAAYKHVPILEAQPREGIWVNVFGTRLVHSLAQAFGVERFILISSDKAVNPINVLGLTKRLGELIVTAGMPPGAAPLTGTPPSIGTTPPAVTTLSTVVRFGNVLGSRGSVIPTFEKQIELGGPITITDPEMTRYFLSIGEAVSLVLQAVAMTRGGDTYILDMGQPVKITDLAHRLIRLHGLRPGLDIPIRYIGLRPGEKLNEELAAEGEEKLPTEHPSIYLIRQKAPLNLTRLDEQVGALIEFSRNGATPEEMRRELCLCLSRLDPASRPLSRGELRQEEPAHRTPFQAGSPASAPTADYTTAKTI